MGTSWSNSRNTTLEYVARSIHTDPPPPPLRTDLGFKKPSSLATGRFTPVPADWLRGRRWEPCVFDEPTADGVAIERRLVYDDGPVAVWVRGEPVWWRNVEEVGTMPTLTYSIYKARFEVNMPEGTTQRTTQAKAPRGHYAIRGLLYECPAGRFGASKGMSHADCSGECQKGYYCPPASVHPRQRICGGPERFCPPGSAFPLLVTTGYYSSTTVDECPRGSGGTRAACATEPLPEHKPAVPEEDRFDGAHGGAPRKPRRRRARRRLRPRAAGTVRGVPVGQVQSYHWGQRGPLRRLRHRCPSAVRIARTASASGAQTARRGRP